MTNEWKGETMMHDKVDDLTESKKGGRFRILKWVLIGSAGLCLLIFFGTPVFLSSAGGTNMLVGKINAAMDGQVAIDDLSVGWFKGVELTNLSYVDEANLSAVHVRQITAQPKYTSLLSNRIKLGKTVIDSPKVHLKVPAGPIAVDEEKPTDVAASVEKKQIDLQMDLEVIDGAATIEVAGPSPQTLELKNIASRVILGQTGQASSVELSAMVDESGAISAKGSAKPAENGWMLADGDFSVQVSKLELASLKPLFAMVGQEMDMAGQLNADATVQVSGGQLTTLQADAVIDNFAQGTGAQRVAFIKPVALSAKTSGSGQTLRIDSLDVNSDFCKISCSGTMEQLDYAVDADLSQTLHFAGQFADLQGMSAKGHVAAAGKVNLTAEKVSIVSDVVVRQLVVQKDTAKTPVTDVALNINSALDKTANQLQIASMDLKATPGAVSIKDLVLPLSGEAIETVSLDAEAKLDLAGVWPFVQVFADVPDDLKLAGMLNSAVKISTQASQIQLVTEGTRVDDLKIARGDDAPFVQDVINLDGDILLDTAAQTVDVRSLQLTGKQGQSLIEVTKGTLENKTSGQNT
ncbi:MAG: AsmA family protein, partial [Planctomycetota bacterium]